MPPQLRPPPTVAHNNTGGGRLEPEAEAPRARSLRRRHDVVVDQNHPARAGAAGKKINVGHLYVVGRGGSEEYVVTRSIAGFSWRWAAIEAWGMEDGGQNSEARSHHRSLASRRLSSGRVASPPFSAAAT